MCRRRSDTDDDDSSVGYSVAVSNSLLKEESFASKNQPPCMNCVLIEMGEMVCYSERCPDCGRIPPGRRKKHQERLKKLIGKKTSAKRPPSRASIEDPLGQPSYLAYRERQEDCIV